MNNVFQLVTLTALLLHGGTNTPKTEIQNVIFTDTTLNNKVFVETDSSFQDFINKFDYRELPFELILGSKDWKDFGSIEPLVEISRDLALQFLCGGDNDVLNKTKNGEYQYYFGYSLKLNDNLGLVYYRTSLDYTGYVLSVFDTLGVLQSSIFLSGVKGVFDPEAQKEAVIGDDCIIEIQEIILNRGVDYLGNIFKADFTKKKYQVSLQVKIVELYNENKLGIDVKCATAQKDRIVIVQ
jgi:hypothetical protein